MADVAQISAIAAGLRQEGYFHLRERLSSDAFEALLGQLGRVLRREDVRMHATKRGVHAPGGIAFHSDQEYVDIIAWRCVHASLEGGATELLDLVALAAQLSAAERKLLEQVMVRCPDPDRVEPPQLVPLLRHDTRGAHFYYNPWMTEQSADASVAAAWDKLQGLVDAAWDESPGVVLAPGECLFLDNRRMLHGRGPLPTDTPRFLKRVWLALEAC